MRKIIANVLPILALAACGQPANETSANETVVPSNDVTVIRENDAPAVAEGDDAIPGTMRGRWGVNVADCDPAQAYAAKGLIDVSDTGIVFYESRAELGSIVASGEGMIRATFDFTGEGMQWQREMSLSLENGGDTLVRREYGDEAMPTPLTYRRCSA